MKASIRPGSQRTTAATAFIAVAGLALLGPATTAWGQDTETQTPPPDTQSGDGVSDGIDFGDNVVIEEDGTVRWNAESENGNAEFDPAQPTPIRAGGVAGTGEIEIDAPPAAVPAPDAAETDEGRPLADPLDSSNAAGSGNRLAMLLGIGGGAIAAVAGLAFFVRSRQRAGANPQVEAVLDAGPSAPADAFVVEDPAAYAGASDAGAYEVGGAAHAQFTDPSYETPDTDEVPASEPKSGRNKLDQLRASMSDLAEKKLADAGQDRMIAKKLEAAGSQMRPGEWLVMGIGATVGALFISTFLLGWLIGAFAAILTGVGFWAGLSYQEGKRQRLFADALPETLQLIAGSLRGGLSMMQAVQTVADEADEPTASEFHRIVTETRLGRDLAISFRDLAHRMASKDFEWVVTAIEIHREVGGDLASILDRVGNTIRSRNRVRGQVKALSAEGRMSGLVLFFLPPVMVFAIAVMNRGYLNEMLNETEGQIMMIVSTVMLLVGGAWLKRLSRFVY